MPNAQFAPQRGQRKINKRPLLISYANFIKIIQTYIFDKKFTKNTCFSIYNMVKYTIENNYKVQRSTQ